MDRAYFDHAATTPLQQEVLEEMLPFFNQQYGNASSLHREGQAAARAVEKARNLRDFNPVVNVLIRFPELVYQIITVPSERPEQR